MSLARTPEIVDFPGFLAIRTHWDGAIRTAAAHS